ncbi:MAG: hypothetical protein QOH56_864 [Pseudonocardiales bacterium]|jgi:hypothetical protein|nr:hypothetical protein [Pseudonocardiales bacterium]
MSSAGFLDEEITVTLVCDHAGTPKRNSGYRKIALVTAIGKLDNVIYLDVTYIGKQPEQDTRLGWSLERLAQDPGLIHMTHRFLCRRCGGYDVPVRRDALYDIVAGLGVLQLSLGQLAAIVNGKR